MTNITKKEFINVISEIILKENQMLMIDKASLNYRIELYWNRKLKLTKKRQDGIVKNILIKINKNCDLVKDYISNKVKKIPTTQHPNFPLLLSHFESLLKNELTAIPPLTDIHVIEKLKSVDDKIFKLNFLIAENTLDKKSLSFDEKNTKNLLFQLLYLKLSVMDDRFTIHDNALHMSIDFDLKYLNGLISIKSKSVKCPCKSFFKIMSNLSRSTLIEAPGRLEKATKQHFTETIKKEGDKHFEKVADFFKNVKVENYKDLINKQDVEYQDIDIILLQQKTSLLSDSVLKLASDNFIKSIGTFGFDDCLVKDFYEKTPKGRKVILYHGKTNSGKTHSSFSHFSDVNSGAYLAPLRLLAMEGQEKIQELGKPCDLITGDFQETDPSNKFVSSTMEMFDTTKHYDVVVIDECQMIFDGNRGWAWSQAILGANATTIVLTGSSDMLSHIRKICEYTGDDFEAYELERLTPLKRLPYELHEVEDIPSQSAIIAFSKREILKLKTEFESNTGKKASVIFGALTPNLRKLESDKFRQGESDIIIATDAISMGLNLPIKNVLFSSLVKFNGKDDGFIDPELAKQIAGRAGRFGMHNSGFYGTFRSDLSTLDMILEKKFLAKECKYPFKMPFKVLLSLSKSLATENIDELTRFYDKAFFIYDPLFIKSDNSEQMRKAMIIEGEINSSKAISLKDKYKIINSPICIEDVGETFIIESIRKLSRGGDFEECQLPNDRVKIINLNGVVEFEKSVKVIDYYLWLSFTFPLSFGLHKNKMNAVKNKLSLNLQAYLEKTPMNKEVKDLMKA